MPFELLDDLDNYLLQLISYLSVLASGVVLTKEGAQHVLNPVASWLGGVLNLAAMSSGLLHTVLQLLVIIVGIVVAFNGLLLVSYAGVRLLKTISE